ncbi:hypothetical protein Tco_0585332 [Tanacetum coccineum]
MNAIPMDNFDDDCQIILLKYWLEDPRPFSRNRKRNHTCYVKDHNTIAHSPEIPEIPVVPWVEHLDIWSDLMWKFRQPDDDWAIVGPYFYALVMRG